MCMCLIILISSSRSKNTISLYVYFYKRCKHVVSIGLFCRSQSFYCLSYGSLELVFWFSPLHTSFILYIFFSYNIWGHSAKCLLHSQRLQGVGRLPCMSGKIIKVCWVMCEGLGMEGGRGRAVARSWLAWGFSQRKLDSAWQTPSSRTTVTFFHEDIKEKIWNHLSKMVRSLLTYFAWPASHLHASGSHKGRASLIRRQSTRVQTGLGKHQVSPVIPVP